MGRTKSAPRASSSGAAIFYGKTPQKSRKRDRPSSIERKTKFTASHVSHPSWTVPLPSSFNFSSTCTSTSTTLVDSHPSSLSSSLYVPDGGETKGWIASIALSSNTTRVVSLIKDVLEMFNNVPYVKIVAGIVYQILEIAEEVHFNKERCYVEKVTNYSRVVFEALLSVTYHSTNNLGDLRDDLLQIASLALSGFIIFESIYANLKSLSGGMYTRVTRRNDILARIEEQDRRLDTTITAFQPSQSISKASHIRHFANTGLKSKPKIMFGREKETALIVDVVLRENGTRLAVLGPGGIGKTSLALSVLHNEQVCAKYNDSRVFISCEAISSVDQLVVKLAFALEIAAEDMNDRVFNSILRRLHQRPHLLVFDNFETPWDPPKTRSEVESLLSEITEVQTVSLLITLRGSQHPSGVSWSQLLPPLQPVDLEAAVEIFPVTLLANLAAVDGETTESLWLRWREESTSMVESGQDRLSSLEFSIQLSISSPRMQRDPGALQFLSILSMLPDGMSPEVLLACEKGLPSTLNFKKAVSTLRQNALVSDDSNRFLRVLSPIRLFMLAHHPPEQNSRLFLEDYYLSLASGYDGVDSQRLKAEVGNIESMLIRCLDSTRAIENVVDAVFDFCHHTYSTGIGSMLPISTAVDRLQVMQITSAISTTHIEAKPPRKGFSRRFGIFPVRKFSQKLVNQPLKDVNSAGKLQADCLGCWGQLLSRQWKHKEAESIFQRAIVLHQRSGDVSGQAYDLHNLGCLLSREVSSLDSAQAKFEEALALHRTCGDKIGEAYDLMGSCNILLQRSRFEEARVSFLDSLKLFVDVEDEPGQASALYNLGKMMQYNSKFVESESYFTRALEIYRKVEDNIGQLESLAGLASSFLLHSKFCEAREYIERAIALGSASIEADHLHFLGRVCIAEWKFPEAKEKLLLATERRSQLGVTLGIADDFHYLAIIEMYHGNLDLALAKNLEAENIYRLQGNKLGLADSLSCKGVIQLHRSNLLAEAKSSLDAAFTLNAEVGCILGQAFDQQSSWFVINQWAFSKENSINHLS
ncbi:hypothetical protein BDQ12DRAFT_737010 [Crucibulum laeve]|uniref:Novel STAND NTPase 1 domain-containing protein n=1 Tax=Crucibulum laeve TaxID=68775 RepID=A0A5C3LWE3_9AGAR|nr:hypothetical protein BDQ12DRAFT_737010 [Crucibulum laeve]